MGGVRCEGCVESAGNDGAAEPDLRGPGPEADPTVREKAGLGDVSSGGRPRRMLDAAVEVAGKRGEPILLKLIPWSCPL
jgi:hypothetical protein